MYSRYFQWPYKVRLDKASIPRTINKKHPHNFNIDARSTLRFLSMTGHTVVWLEISITHLQLHINSLKIYMKEYFKGKLWNWERCINVLIFCGGLLLLPSKIKVSFCCVPRSLRHRSIFLTLALLKMWQLEPLFYVKRSLTPQKQDKILKILMVFLQNALSAQWIEL